MNKNSTHKYKLSVITATYNAIEYLPSLIECLRKQEDQDFEWVVADGASTDGTLELLESITDLNIVITSQEDFGIYDALNSRPLHGRLLENKFLACERSKRLQPYIRPVDAGV